MSHEITPAKMAVMLSVGLFSVWLFGVGEVFAAAASELTRTHSGSGVTVSVTYLNPKGSEGPRFQVALNTHSVDLDTYDLKDLSSLRDGTGKSYQPLQAENKGSGHHREVVVTFPKLSAQTKSLVLVIQNVTGVKERIFRWGF